MAAPVCPSCGSASPCAECAADARAFYREPPTALIRRAALWTLGSVGLGWLCSQIAIGISIAQHLAP